MNDEVTTFAQLWADSVDAHSDAVFLRFEGPDGSVTQWTYSEFDHRVAAVAALLTANSVKPGNAVHLALTNCPTFIAVWIAAARLGAWIVPSDPMARTAELVDHLERTAPVVGFCAATRRETYRAAAPADLVVIEIDEADASFAPFSNSDSDSNSNSDSGSDSSFDTGFTNWPEPAPTDTAAVMFTSGTTGRPKGVVITQANYAFVGKTMAEAAQLTAQDRQLVVLPLFHANAQYYSFASAISVGASVALIHTFSASGFLEQVARHEATCASLFAAPMRMILARGGPVPGAALRHCWFAQNLADDQYETLSEWFGCRPRQLYGMTETIPAVLTNDATEPRPDSMGFVTKGCEVELHDADGHPVAVGQVGEVVVRGERGISLFQEYLSDPETTAASFRGPWFRTGDRAIVDADGRFFFDGRRSDVLKVSGENVSIVEVESVLTEHPAVLEASVVGAPDPIRDEVPVAFVVALDPESPPTVEDLMAWCDERLAKAKQPRDITFLEELPRTSVGKIRKFLLQQASDQP
ncbi:MAG: class I adenylate-forming enzyme family protein [Acidimicrobiales bacterium]